jgi:hypothetical protein
MIDLGIGLDVASRFDRGIVMTRGEIIEYRRMNSGDRTAFHRWLVANTVVGAISLLALIAMTSIFSGGGSSSVTAQKSEMTVHAEAK